MKETMCMKKMKNVAAVFLACFLAVGNGTILWAAEDRAEVQITQEEETQSIISQLTGLPYIGGQRFDTPLVMQDEMMELQNVDEQGILGCLKWDFDNDNSDEILAVTYGPSESFGAENKCVRVAMYELNVDTWMASDMFELAEYDREGRFKDLATISGSNMTAYEGNLFLRRVNGQYQFFYEYNASPKYLASGTEWYLKGYTYDGSNFSVIENTLNMAYAGSGPEADALFHLNPDSQSSYGQSIANIIKRYKELGFQVEQIGGDGENFYSTASQDPNCHSLVRFLRGDNLDGESVYERLRAEGRLDGFWIDIEDNTSSIRDIGDQAQTEEELTDSDTVSVSGCYEEFLKTNHAGDYYTIVEAGENQESILVVATGFSERNEDIYTPELGYDIVIYGTDGGAVHQIGEPLHLSESSGPWYFYGNKLICNSRKGGYYTVDITGDTYTQNIHHDGSSSDWKPLSLRKNRGAAGEQTQPSTEDTTVSGQYILPDSNSEYLTEEILISRGLTKEQLGLARNEIFARHGRMFDTPEIQQYFDSRSWYAPRYAPAEFDAMGDGIFNEYEKYNMESIKALEDKLG